MAVGPVNRALLESNFQNAGDIYSDLNTEACFDVVADQIDDNAAIFSAGGLELIGTQPITGVVGDNPYEQMVYMEGQIQAAVGGIVPPNTVTTAMLQDEAVTFAKLEKTLQTSAVAGLLTAYRSLGGAI